MSDKINGMKCPRCESAGSVKVYIKFRNAVWFQDDKCDHIFEVKKEEFGELGITESEVAKYSAAIARDL